MQGFIFKFALIPQMNCWSYIIVYYNCRCTWMFTVVWYVFFTELCCCCCCYLLSVRCEAITIHLILVSSCHFSCSTVVRTVAHLRKWQCKSAKYRTINIFFWRYTHYSQLMHLTVKKNSKFYTASHLDCSWATCWPMNLGSGADRIFFYSVWPVDWLIELLQNC